MEQFFERFVSNIEYYDNEQKEVKNSDCNDLDIIETSIGAKCDKNKLLTDTLSFLEWLQSNDIKLDQDTLNYAQLVYGTESCVDIKHLGLRQYIKSSFEWNLGEGVVHLRGQYYKLIKYFKDRLENEYKDIVKIIVNSAVNKIIYGDIDDVMVYAKNGIIVKCKVILNTFYLKELKSFCYSLITTMIILDIIS